MTFPVDSSYIEKVAHSPEGITIDFNRIPAIRIEAKNINQSTLTGPIGASHDFNRCNITSSTLESVHAFHAELPSVDFKDCLIIDSDFAESTFNGLAFVNNTVVRCQFENSQFNDTSIMDSEFVEVTFSRCDFSNLLIKGCRFVRCSFVQCVTTNKLFENCLVLDCGFERTTLQVQTITSNFGLTAEQLQECGIRSRDPKVQFEYVDSEVLERLGIDLATSPIERLRIDYFLQPEVLWGSDALDAALDARGWLRLCRIPSTFAILLQDFSEFLLWSYDQNRLTVHPLLLLHTLTSQLSSHFGSDASANPRVSRAIMGVHMQLSRTVEDFLAVLAGLVATLTKRVRFVANGPLDATFYHRELEHAFVEREVRLSEVKPHNSPVELVFEWVSLHGATCLLAAFAASRVKAEIYRLGAVVPDPDRGSVARIGSGRRKRPSSLRRIGGINRQSMEVFSYSMGYASARSRAYEIKARALLPGSLLVELRLEVKTGILQKFRRILRELLTPHEIAN